MIRHTVVFRLKHLKGSAAERKFLSSAIQHIAAQAAAILSLRADFSIADFLRRDLNAKGTASTSAKG